MLPGIQHVHSPEVKEGSSTLEHTHRLREIAIQEMVEASAKARLGRALNTKSTPAAQKMELKIGDEVDFYRSPATKDIPGWQGPATVVDISGITRGVFSLRWNSRTMEVQTQRVRRHLYFWGLIQCSRRATSRWTFHQSQHLEKSSILRGITSHGKQYHCGKGSLRKWVDPKSD